MDRLSRRKVLLLVVLALALRLGLIVAAGPFTEPDSLTYDNLARNLAGGQGYSDTRPFKILDGSMSVPPVYPGFLAAVYAVFGFRYGPVIVIQQVLGALLAALACLIATRLFGGRIGFWTGLIVALHPWLIVYGSTLMTEALFTFLFAASMCFLVKGLFSGRVLDFALAGLVMGLAILCRASFQYYVLLIPVVLLVALKDFKRAAWHSLAYLVPVLFLLGGWCLRNQRTHGFFGLTSVGGINFIAGLNPPPSSYDLRDPFEKALLEACNSPATRTIASVIPPSGQGRMVFKSGTVYCTNEAAKTLLDQGYSLAEVDREFTRIALKQVRKAPVRYLKRAGAQGIALWSGYQTDWLGGSFEKTLQENVRDRDHVAAAVKVIFRLVLGASVFIMTAVGIGAMIKNGFRMGWVPVSTFTYLTAVCAALNLGYIRYRIPLEPYIVMTCLYGLSFLCNRFPVLRGGRG